MGKSISKTLAMPKQQKSFAQNILLHSTESAYYVYATDPTETKPTRTSTRPGGATQITWEAGRSA